MVQKASQANRSILRKAIRSRGQGFGRVEDAKGRQDQGNGRCDQKGMTPPEPGAPTVRDDSDDRVRDRIADQGQHDGRADEGVGETDDLVVVDRDEATEEAEEHGLSGGAYAERQLPPKRNRTLTLAGFVATVHSHFDLLPRSGDGSTFSWAFVKLSELRINSRSRTEDVSCPEEEDLLAQV